MGVQKSECINTVKQCLKNSRNSKCYSLLILLLIIITKAPPEGQQNYNQYSQSISEITS